MAEIKSPKKPQSTVRFLRKVRRSYQDLISSLADPAKKIKLEVIYISITRNVLLYLKTQ